MYREYYVTSPLDALRRISDVLRWNGWTLELDSESDQTSYQSRTVGGSTPYFDGELTVAKKDGVVVMFRTMHGLPVFEGQFQHIDPTGSYNLSPYFHGMVMTACTDYTHNECVEQVDQSTGNITVVQRTDAWHEQEGILKDINGQAFGVGMPFPCGVAARVDDNGDPYIDEADKIKLYINYCTEPTISLTVTLRQGYKEPVAKGDYYDSALDSDVIRRYQFCHMSFCMVNKVGRWDGGLVISGSFNSDTMVSDVSGLYETIDDSDVGNSDTSYNGILKNDEFDTEAYDYALFRFSKTFDSQVNMLYSMSSTPTTFCMIYVDNAPSRVPTIWASVGEKTSNWYTGKTLCTSVGTVEYKNNIPPVPHFTYLFSETPTDYGRNSNTLNNITLDLPIALYILRDPDILGNYSHIGYLSNIFEVSLRNIQTTNRYEVAYPKSGIFHRVFSHGMRCGKYGYDGIALTMEQDTPEATAAIADDANRTMNVNVVKNTFNSVESTKFVYDKDYVIFDGVMKQRFNYRYKMNQKPMLGNDLFSESDNIPLNKFKKLINVEVNENGTN